MGHVHWVGGTLTPTAVTMEGLVVVVVGGGVEWVGENWKPDSGRGSWP